MSIPPRRSVEFAAAEPAADAATLAEVRARLAVDERRLTEACDGGLDEAWSRLRDLYVPRLQGLVRSREGAHVDPVAAVDEFLSELALPPASGSARMRIGTFNASGPLWSWLAAGLVHRLLRRSRDRLQPSGGVGEAVHERTPADREPSDVLVDAEAALSLDRALTEGWHRLEPLERVAVVWKHRHGLPQRRIAALLGLGEDRVSRLLDRAIAKLRGPVTATIGNDPGERDAPRWNAFVERLAVHLARVDDRPIPELPALARPRVTE